MHPVVLGLFDEPAAAAAAARHLRALGIEREHVSIVARSHDEEGAISEVSGASPGSEIEDSLQASRLGELSGHLLAAIAVVMPGIGPIVADGPLAAGLGEAAGHLAGGIARTLQRAGIAQAKAQDLESQIEAGAVLVGAHVVAGDVDMVRDALMRAGGRAISVGRWGD